MPTEYQKIAENDLDYNRQILSRCISALFEENDSNKILEIISALRFVAYKINRVGDRLSTGINLKGYL